MLASNTTLVELDLRFNGIYDNGAEIIKEMFRAGEDGIRLNTTLTKLLLPENKIAIELIDEINKLISGARKKGKKGKKKGR